MHTQVIVVFVVCEKKLKKRNFFETLIACISGMAEGIFFKFGVASSEWRCKFGAIRIKHHGAMGA